MAAWGANNNGQLGNSSTTATSLPSSVLTSGALAGKTVTQVTAGEAHSCAVTSDGGVYCWGSNTYGQLGNNSWSQSAVPIAVDTTGVLAGKAVIQVEAGYRHTCAVTSDGAAFCWGYNAFGQLGNNSTGSSPVPVAVDTSGVLAGKTLTQVASGGYHTCALSADAAVFCWGHGTAGNLGNNGWTHSQVPVAVDNNGVLAGKTVTQLDSGFHHACVVTSDGGVFCWGYNVFGQLGDGTMTGSAAPVAVDISGALASKTNAQVATGYYQTCALSTDGAVFCWGVNDYGLR